VPAGRFGLSRLVLGVHFAFDVIAEFVSGTACLVLRIAAAKPGPPMRAFSEITGGWCP
jgi:membrane-associated phospholipid phosphatase